MFGCCCNVAPPFTSYWSLAAVGAARWGGFCPFEVTDGTLIGGKYKSTTPLKNSLYRKVTIYEKEWFYVLPDPPFYTELVQEFYIHEEMGDHYWWRAIQDGVEFDSWERNDDGSVSGSPFTPPVFGDMDGGSSYWYSSKSAFYTETSRTATRIDFSGFVTSGAGTDEAYIELSDPITLDDALNDADTLRDLIDTHSPGGSYVPGVAPTYTIDGATKILYPIPTEYYGTGDQSKFFALKNSKWNSFNYEPVDWFIQIAYERTGSGLLVKNKSIHPGFLEGVAPHTRTLGPGIAAATRGTCLRKFNDWSSLSGNTSNLDVWDDGRLVAPIMCFSTKSKVLLDKLGHDFSVGGVHAGGDIENTSTFSGWSWPDLTNKSSFARSTAGVAPASYKGPSVEGLLDVVELEWADPVGFVDADMPTATTKKVRGAAIFSPSI